MKKQFRHCIPAIGRTIPVNQCLQCAVSHHQDAAWRHSQEIHAQEVTRTTTCRDFLFLCGFSRASDSHTAPSPTGKSATGDLRGVVPCLPAVLLSDTSGRVPGTSSDGRQRQRQRRPAATARRRRRVGGIILLVDSCLRSRGQRERATAATPAGTGHGVAG